MDSVDSARPTQPAQAPSLHHHQTMQGTGQAPPTPHTIAPHPNAGRPGLDRAHTFPTPPTSASSVMGMSNQGSSYDWGNQNMANGAAGAQPLSIDTGMNARSMPTTPATTPPGTAGQGMQPYQSQPGYDNSKHFYSTTPSSQTGYAQHPDGSRYGQSIPPYGKSDMGPPTAPGTASAGPDGHETKADAYSQVTAQSHGSQHESDHPDSGYMSANTSAYSSNRGQYAYNAAGEHPHLSPEMSGSPSHQNGSGHATPRTMPTGQPQWPQDYHTPPRTAPSSNVYNVMGNARTPAGAGSGDNYGNPTYSGAGHPATLTSAKRGREDDDQDRPGSREYDAYDPKRRKVGRQDTFAMPLNTPPHMQAIKTGGQR